MLSSVSAIQHGVVYNKFTVGDALHKLAMREG